MEISRVKHISFEVYLLGSILLYLLGLSFVLKFVLREDEWMKKNK